ncbi:MAG: Major intrinsic protein [Nitrosopumilales archaeon]|nr:MAG: Major intrinsic protein [Nitrosopumilales archaeon]
MHKSNLIIFIAELVGTFGLVIAATVSVVYDGRFGQILGPIGNAVVHFVGISTMIFVFGKYSMAHLNPAVTIGFFISGYIKAKKIPLYFVAQTIGAILGSLFVKQVVGNYGNLGLNFPNYQYSIPLFYGIEILATVFLMGGILIVVSKKKLPMAIISIVISAIIAFDVFFLSPISGASMNPIRSVAPALLSGILDDLWLYLTAPFIGSIIVALIYRNKFSKNLLSNSSV